jgi:multidrug efflux system membrane fusion protein
MQPVRVGQMTNGISVIDKGLDPGTRVVVSGQYRLQPESRVQVAPADSHVASQQ